MLSPWNAPQYTSVKQQTVRESKASQNNVNDFPDGSSELLQNLLPSLKIYAAFWIFSEQLRRTSENTLLSAFSHHIPEITGSFQRSPNSCA